MSKFAMTVTALSLATAMQCYGTEDANLTTDDLLSMDLEQLMDVEVSEVYGASKVQQKSIDAPSSVSVITAKDIRRFGYRTLGDAVAGQSGFYTYYDRNYQYLGVRGFGRPGDYNTRILLMIDGQRINDNIYDAASVGTDFPLDMDMVDHIEVIRGPGSALYGNSAFFAVINVITKTAQHGENGFVSAEVGSFGTDKASFALTHTFDNGMDMTVMASRYHSQGQDLYYKVYDTPETNNGVAKDMDEDKAKNLFIKARLGDFTLEAVMNRRQKWIPTAAWEMAFNDHNAYTVDEHSFLNMKYSKNLSQKWQVDAQLAYNSYDYEGSYPYEEEGEIVVYKDDTPGRWIDGNVDFKYSATEHNRWLAGAWYYHNLKQKLRYYVDDETLSEADEKNDIYALYLQNIYDYRKFSLTTGLRYDHYDTFGGIVNPRIAAIYHVDTLSALKLLYGQAFRAPNIYERAYDDGEDTQKGNPNLDPEKIKTYEVVFEHYLEKHDYLSVGAFYYTIDDLITQVVDPEDELLFFQNVDKVASRGVELNYKKPFGNGSEASFNYTFAYSVDSRSDTWLTNSPKHVANLTYTVPLVDDKYRLGTTLQYNSSIKTPKDEKVDGFLIANLTLNASDVGVKGLDLDMRIHNLFDSDYANTTGEEHMQHEIVQDGISGSLKVTYHF